MKQPVSLVVLDLDNTLFDWFRIWHASFSSMLDSLVVASGINRGRLIDDFRRIHQHHRTTEYAFSIAELPSLKAKHPIGADLTEIYKDAILAFRSARKANMTLYPSVRETLTSFKQLGVALVAYTESLEFYTRYRLIKLGLDELLDYLYSPPDHALPENMTPEQIRHYPSSHYELKHTQQRNTPRGELKPNPHLLKRILEEVDARVDRTIYVGDSKMKDIAMANAAGVSSVWAKYGAFPPAHQYKLLQEVTHWTKEDVELEAAIKAGTAGSESVPQITLERTFDEVLSHFEFVRFDA